MSYALYVVRITQRDEALQYDNGKSGDELLLITTKDPKYANRWEDRAVADSVAYDLRDRGIEAETMPLEEFVNGLP